MRKLALIIGLFVLNTAYATENVQKINSMIIESEAQWTAAENWTTALTLEERRNLCGSFMQPANPADAELMAIDAVSSLPAQLDWRMNNGNWVTPVRNQGGCGSCWDFSAVGQIEAWWKIRNGDPNADIDLSEQFILSCSEGGCDGWWVSGALDFVKENGIPTENCFRYYADDTVPCSNACENWQNEAIKIPGWGYITLSEAIVENIKNAVYRHPVSASFTVYEDFNYYSGGVYEHVWGSELAGHAILIVGWNDAEQSWICKNSWGENWGENGYFRIKWGDSGMGTYMSYIWDDVIGNSSLSVNPENLQFSLFSGEQFEQDLVITNNGLEQLEFILIDYEVPVAFHADDFNAWDGMSWWCGDEKIGGYENHWLQYLDTPVIDLSSASQPELTFKARWDVERGDGASQPYDGWDGCNVWVSVDGGDSFTPLYPDYPQYDSNSLFSFGDADQGWDLGSGVPGWTGSSAGWQDAKVNLAAYQNASAVVIRFAFASDKGLCTIDDPGLTGFFVDEVMVIDGANVLFRDSAGTDTEMLAKGYGSKNADWMQISYHAGLLKSAESMTATVGIDTRELEPGHYRGLIQMNTNDTTRSMLELPVQLEVKMASHDLAVEEIIVPDLGLAILSSQEIEAVVENKGYSQESNITAVCTIVNNDLVIYNDVVQIGSLASGARKVIRFAPFYATEAGTMKIRVELSDVDDFNNFNNARETELAVTNLFESFENLDGKWRLSGGWGTTMFYGAHTGQTAAHVNNGVIPYPNDMNAVMTYDEGLIVQNLSALTLKYYAKYFTEKDTDICYMEVSTDKMTWTAEDSISGMDLTWAQREVDLKKYLSQGEKIWFRFRFISNGSIVNFGTLIDDLEIYPTLATRVVNQTPHENIPVDWQLSQNYPNPFNMKTTITYTLKDAGPVTLRIFDTTGRIVRTLIHSSQSAGHHMIDWDGRDDFGIAVSTGVYFYRMTAGNAYAVTNKMILLK